MIGASETASSRPGHAPRLGQASMPDSPPQAIHGLLSAYPDRAAAPAIHRCDFGCGSEAAVRPSRVLAVHRSPVGRLDRLTRIGATPNQIARASCRESVCQYVYISVIAVSLKKNNHTTFL